MGFFGENKGHLPEKEVGGWHMNGPLILLMILSLVGGFITVPVEAVFSHGAAHGEHHVSALVHGFMIAMPLVGIFISYMFFYTKKWSIEDLMSRPIAQKLHKLWHSGWGMDWLYDRIFVFPFVWLSRINKDDLIDKLYTFIAMVSRLANTYVVRTQTGYLRWYALSVACGLIIILVVGVLL